MESILIGLAALSAALSVACLVLLARQGGQARRFKRELERQQRGTVEAVSSILDPLMQLERSQVDSIDRHLSASQAQMQRMAQESEALRLRTAEQLERLSQGNARQLELMRQTVEEKLESSLERRLNQSFSQVSQRLEAVYRGLGEMQTLAAGVGDLKKVLTNVKTRGVWGEVQLGALLEQTLAPGQYLKNVATRPGSAERVEFAVRMPGQGEGEVLLPIDAKFPQEDYLRLLSAQEAGDAAAAAAAGQALEQAVKVQAKRISDKYVQPPATTDFALLFLPTEGLYAEVLRRDGLCEALQRQYRVVPAGPTTLCALLNSLQMGFRTLAIERRSGEVWQLLGEVKQDFARFADTLAKTQQRLRQASDSIEDAARKTRTIERRLRGVQQAEAVPAPADLADGAQELG